MSLLLLLLLDSWPVSYGQAVVHQLHSYDLLRYDVKATPAAKGLAVECDLTLRLERAGPLRFFLSPEIDRLEVTRKGKPVPATLAGAAFDAVLRLLAPGAKGAPGLLTLAPDPPLPAGATATFHLTYTWRPKGDGFSYASGGAVQTHLASFWLPAMADELFEATVEGGAVASTSKHPQQVLALVAGDFTTTKRGRLRLLLPPNLDADADAERLLDDLQLVLGKLESWFGPGPEEFALVVEPRLEPAPSYCAGSFAVVHRRYLELERAHWLSHLAHECSHIWWGHRVATPVVGQGGTWLREGLAQWSGIKTAGALLGEETERKLWRANFRGYIRRIDLRRNEDGRVFANEPTLLDATYIDDPAVPYLRGALVLRLLDPSFAQLKEFAKAHAHTFAAVSDFPADPTQVAYYAGTTRLPDFALTDVNANSARVRCLDPLWPGGRLPCRVETDAGPVDVTVELRAAKAGTLTWKGRANRIELDPERVFLDPVRGNNLWPRE